MQDNGRREECQNPGRIVPEEAREQRRDQSSHERECESQKCQGRNIHRPGLLLYVFTIQSIEDPT